MQVDLMIDNKFENESIQELPNEVFLTFDDGPSVNNKKK
jgi:hypothetical protein